MDEHPVRDLALDVGLRVVWARYGFTQGYRHVSDGGGLVEEQPPRPTLVIHRP